MLGPLVIILATYLLAKKRNVEINTQLVTSAYTVVILIVVAFVVFWLLHCLLSKEKNFKRYEDNWEEDNIRIARGITAIAEALLYMFIVLNINNGVSLFHGQWLLIAFIVLMNIIEMVLIDHEYSLNIRELIVDTILMQIQDNRNALIISLVVLCALSWTTFGVVMAIIFLGIIFR